MAEAHLVERAATSPGWRGPGAGRYNRPAMVRSRCFAACLALAACGQRADPEGDLDAAPGTRDAAADDAVGDGADAFGVDASGPADALAGVLNGGPCLSGTPGVTAYRIRWAGNGSGSTAYVVYEVNGLPDHTRDHAAAYGYSVGYTPRFEDVFLGDGGLVLDSSGFIDLELTTAGISQIASATVSIYGRSYNTTASGSFNWQTFEGVGAAPTNVVSNAAPYAWYSADMTSEINAGDSGVLIRIKAGPSSGSLVVNRVEICMTAS